MSRRRFRVAPSLFLAATFSILATSAWSAESKFEDSWIHVELPKSWTIEGESGEYMLESDTQDIASLLVLSPDPERTIEEVLAEIEEQFLSTGMFTLENTEERQVDGEPVHVRRYRMTGGPGRGEDATATIHHQYSFWRDDVQILLEVETGDKSAAPERLFSKVFSTLRVLEPPVPFLFEDYGDELDEEMDTAPDENPESMDDAAADSADMIPAEEEDAPELSP